MYAAHPLRNATSFQLALVVDTLMAERQLLSINASLASHMAGAGSPLQAWLEARVLETDATIVEVARIAIFANDGSEDAKLDRDHICDVAVKVLTDRADLVDVGDLIGAHKAARAMDPDTREAEDALNKADDALFAYRPITAADHAERATYLLSKAALDLYHWDVKDIRDFLLSVA